VQRRTRLGPESRCGGPRGKTVETMFGTLMPEDRKSRRISAEGQKLLQQICEEIRDHDKHELGPTEIKATVKLLRDMKRRAWLPSSPAPEDWNAIVGKGLRRTYRQGRALFAVSNSVGLSTQVTSFGTKLVKERKHLGINCASCGKSGPEH